MTEKYDPQPHGKPILCLDFDGCIHSYKTGWQGVDKIPDDPVPGVFLWMKTALNYFEIHIYSSRSSDTKGRAAMYFYIRNYSPEVARKVVFVKEKPRAYITIDDRCVQFNGKWEDPAFDPEVLLQFQPWYKSQK
jgi:hypothetical protein